MYLRIAVAAAIVVGVVVVAWGPMSDYRHRQSAAGIDEARQAKAQRVIDDALHARVSKLNDDRCAGVAFSVIQANSEKAIATAADMAPDALSDLKLCVERRILSPYARDQLSDAGLLKFANPL
jgi:hypothetical protein